MKLNQILLGAMISVESFIGLPMPNLEGYVHQATVSAQCDKNKEILIFDAYRKETEFESEFMTIKEQNKKPFGVFIFEYNILAVDRNYDKIIDQSINIDEMVLQKKNVCDYIPK